MIKQLSQSTSRDSSFINSMLRIGLEEMPSNIDPELIVNVSIESGNYNLGIMLLEKMILKLMEEKKNGA